LLGVVVLWKYGNLWCMKKITEKILTKCRWESILRCITPWVAWVNSWIANQSYKVHVHALGEANFSDHGANRLGASALMQGLMMVIVGLYTLGKII
jgi:hypothetical protein